MFQQNLRGRGGAHQADGVVCKTGLSTRKLPRALRKAWRCRLVRADHKSQTSWRLPWKGSSLWPQDQHKMAQRHFSERTVGRQAGMKTSPNLVWEAAWDPHATSHTDLTLCPPYSCQSSAGPQETAHHGPLLLVVGKIKLPHSGPPENA